MSNYNNIIDSKSNLTNKIFYSMSNNEKPLTKQISYNAIQIETEKLLNREKTLFTINTVVAVCLFITIFKTT
jgi:hypothetical protein|uniref:Uncharacterized protein n=1 Tax=viral metagenome TaxID=1070528 RepID=A0A6C0ET66_9ZZZZ